MRKAFMLRAFGLFLVGAAGCTATAPTSTPKPMPSSSASPPHSSAPPSPADAAASNALAAYSAMWRDFVAAGVTSDWRSSMLGQHATGIALSTLSRGMYADHYSGLVTKGSPVLHPTVVSMAPAQHPTTVVINDCGDSAHFMKYHQDTGAPASDGPGGRQFIKATVHRQSDNSWKVSDFGIQAVGSC
jgi:hypothetical protein